MSIINPNEIIDSGKTPESMISTQAIALKLNLPETTVRRYILKSELNYLVLGDSVFLYNTDLLELLEKLAGAQNISRQEKKTRDATRRAKERALILIAKELSSSDPSKFDELKIKVQGHPKNPST